jgi:hypothetical protein
MEWEESERLSLEWVSEVLGTLLLEWVLEVLGTQLGTQL